jgi:hypothetical protein
LLSATTAWAAYSPPTGNDRTNGDDDFEVTYCDELKGWKDGEIVYYYVPGTNNWTNTEPPAGTVNLNPNGSFTASGSAAPPSSGTYARVI